MTWTNAILQDIGRKIDKLYQEREDIDNQLEVTRASLRPHALMTGAQWMDYPVIRELRQRSKAIDSELQVLYQDAAYEKLQLSLHSKKCNCKNNKL